MHAQYSQPMAWTLYHRSLSDGFDIWVVRLVVGEASVSALHTQTTRVLNPQASY